MAASPYDTIENVITGYLDGKKSKVLAEFATTAHVTGHRRGEHYRSKKALTKDLIAELGTQVLGPMAARQVAPGEITFHGNNTAVFHRPAQVEFPGEGLEDGTWTVVLRRMRIGRPNWDREVRDKHRRKRYGDNLGGHPAWWLIVSSHFSVTKH